MTRFFWIAFVPLCLIPLAWAWGDTAQTDGEKPTIKSIMKVAFKEGLARKVATGKATADEQAEFLKLSKALQELKPPQGDAESWTEKTKSLVEATQAVIDKQAEGAALFRTATNCMTCHEVHKPK